MLYKESAQYSAIGKAVTLEIEDNGNFRIYNKKDTFQSGNLHDYYLGSGGFGPTVGVYFWRRGSSPDRVGNELLLYDNQANSQSNEAVQRFYEKKRELFEIAKPFGATSIIKRPGLRTVIAWLVFLSIFVLAVLQDSR